MTVYFRYHRKNTANRREEYRDRIKEGQHQQQKKQKTAEKKLSKRTKSTDSQVKLKEVQVFEAATEDFQVIASVRWCEHDER